MATPESRPPISPMQWATAREVLPHEALDFTPWLAENLHLLADVLGLDGLEIVATEWRVETFALDILARGTDADGDVEVVIENQYGHTDHKHLGQLLTYAAHAAAGGRRVLAVWLTEDVRPAHQAAVEFINRVAAEGSTFGMVLLRVRFAPARVGWHVHFEVDSEPNAFLSQPTPQTSRPRSATQGSFIEAVATVLDPLLENAGLRRRGAVNTRNGAVIYKFPPKLAVASLATARVVCSSTTTNVALFFERYPDAERNWATAEVLRRAYEGLVERYGIQVDDWHGSGATVKRDRILTQLPTGYTDGDAATVATQAAEFVNGFTQMMTEHPISDIERAVEQLASQAAAYAWGERGHEDNS